MGNFLDRSPRLTVRLYKTIGRKNIAGNVSVSTRYENKAEYIDLTPFLGDGSSVVTSKSVRDPAGAFSITFPDRAHQQLTSQSTSAPAYDLESIYGLVEPMDVIEIRMWGGVGPAPAEFPIKMRGFISRIDRTMAAGDNGQPVRSVVVSGQDYGKIWQTFQISHMASNIEGNPILTTYALSKLFGVGVENTMRADEYVREMITKIINPHIKGFMPENSPMPTELLVDGNILVKTGGVNLSYQSLQGSLYDGMRPHADVGIWNELYTEDREDGVHVIYRPTPSLHITPPDGSETRKIQPDAPDPIYVEIPDGSIKALQMSRSDSNVANYYWVNNSRFDLQDDMVRKMAGLSGDDETIRLVDYPNSAIKYYGVRMMEATTQQGDTDVKNMLGTSDRAELEKRGLLNEAWINRRRRLMVEMNRDNVVFESGSARVQGGIMRADGSGPMRAGDYARFKIGTTVSDAYIVSITEEFMPYHGYTAMLSLERGEGFVNRTTGGSSPWLAEQATRGGSA